ncbi:hypothetical protein [Pseudonocardia broussonetiae]|uniref:Uncharacterized protein n=1 Tax=Pseudonocardia broussonetiae TaxID=2736640 RepID=A0A6M6JGM1_9PSEU|nr:hypothetical protein [Pseudonocardia broussonetiae]QJY46636.1 hypothetical protein HOP40_13090 [Pseudonocardia broussonetiae]
MTHVLLAAAMSWFGWAWLDRIPVALALSQLPAAVTVLAWAAEHAHHVQLPAWPQPRPARDEVPTGEQSA